MVSSQGKAHLVGVVVASAVSILLLATLVPHLVDLVFPPGERTTGIRRVSRYYVTVALIPVILWLVPPFVRALGRLAYGTHRALLGRDAFYVRFPTARQVRFADTALQSVGPFAIDLLVITELTYFISTPDAQRLGEGLVAIPALLLLAGLVTALLPGGWLLDDLDLRLVAPRKGQVVRVAELYERFLGPISAVALLASFVTVLHSVNESYEQALVSLLEWGLLLFPPVLAAVAVFRLVVMPDVRPGLEAWSDRAGIGVTRSLGDVLEALRIGSGEGGPATGEDAARTDGTQDPPREP